MLAACSWCTQQVNNLPMRVSSFRFVGLTEKCDKKFNVLEFERRKLKKIKE